jgi:FkbM family methyltransferase
MLGRLKASLKQSLQARGWYIRKVAGLPTGIDLFADLRRFGLDPKCILDVGAHEGRTAIEYADAFPKAKIFAFEPVSENFAKLTNTTIQRHQIEPIRAALGSHSGKAMIHLYPGNSQGHSIARCRAGGSEEIEVTTIDDFCVVRDLRPDFIKIDVEGYELEVISGARTILAASGPRAILVEATLNPNNSWHIQLDDVIAAVRPSGFKLAGIYEQTSWGTPELEFFNALFFKFRARMG